MPHSFTPPWTGKTVQSHPEPAFSGYYKNWDPYAVTLEVTPVEDVNPVGTQHIFIATVKDKEGKSLPGRRVEWMLSDGVGSIVEVDESGNWDSRGYKVDNRFAVSHTNYGEHVMTRGNTDPSDDISLKRGQTWCVITSPLEGTSYVVAYAPSIYNWDKHKVFMKKHWFDTGWEFPPEATNPFGTAHKFTTKVTTYVDKKPLPGFEVTYTILSGPEGTLDPGGGTTAKVKTDAQGLATVTLKQVKPVEGVNELQIDIVKPAAEAGAAPVHMATGKTRKTWIGPKIAITKTAPPTAVAGQNFDYNIVVSNPSKVATTNTVLTDTLPDGIVYVSSAPEAKVDGQNLSWSLGRLEPGATSSAKVTVKGTRTGKFTNPARVTADYGLSANASADTVITQPKLQVTKTAPAEVLICEPINYTFTVTNQGDAPATNVRLEDKLPDGLVYQEKYTTITADFGTVAAGESKRVQYAVTPTKTGNYTNTVTIKGDGGLTASADAKTVVRQPVLAITKDAPKTRFAGRDITYNITVTNKGDGVARNTVVMDSVPNGSTFVSASDGVKPDTAGKLSWSLGDLAPEQSKKVSFTVKPTVMGEIESLSTVSAICAKGSAKAITAVQGIPAVLLECVDVTDPIEVGQQETYVITVTNQGTAADTGIVIKCTLPGEEQYVSASGPTKETAEGQTVTFAPLKSLDPKAVATYKVVVKALKEGDVRFKVVLTSDQLKSSVEETEATHLFAE